MLELLFFGNRDNSSIKEPTEFMGYYQLPLLYPVEILIGYADIPTPLKNPAITGSGIGYEGEQAALAGPRLSSISYSDTAVAALKGPVITSISY